MAHIQISLIVFKFSFKTRPVSILFICFFIFYNTDIFKTAPANYLVGRPLVWTCLIMFSWLESG